MDDYISRRDLLARYDAEHKGAPGRARELIEQAPAADVAPVVHGKWYVLDDCANAGLYCSVCHKKVFNIEYANQKQRSSYCPSCGAKMDKEDNT